jgi:hypothetical protein
MIWTVQLIDCKKKGELNNNLVNFHDLNFSIIQIELLNMQKQYENMAIHLFFVTDFESWDNLIEKIWKVGKFNPIWQ